MSQVIGCVDLGDTYLMLRLLAMHADQDGAVLRHSRDVPGGGLAASCD